MAGKPKIPIDQLIGKKINHLTFLSPNPEGGPGHFWFLCDCGNIKSIQRYHVLHETTKACGCIKVGRKSRRQDITGQRFGKLLAEEIDVNKTDTIGPEWWLCQCDCGNKISAEYNRLVTGQTVSCRCINAERIRSPEIIEKCHQSNANRYKNLAATHLNKKYHRLIVTHIFETDESQNSKQDRECLCLCECGNQSRHRLYTVVNGNTKSCGCLKRECEEKLFQDLRKWIYRKDNTSILMRSSYELMFAEILDERGIEWEYECKLFDLSNGHLYLPDFYIPETDEWFEIKGRILEDAQDKINGFIEDGYNLQVIRKQDLEDMMGMKWFKFYMERRRTNHLDPIPESFK